MKKKIFQRITFNFLPPMINNIKFFVKKYQELIFIIIIIASFLFLHIYKMADISYTYDEKVDAFIIDCYAHSGDFWSCNQDISQPRLPYFIHLFFNSILWQFAGKYSNYIVSMIFGLFNLLLMYAFIKKEFADKIAKITALLMLTSIPLLASSRMILTHSNVIFSTFTILTIICFYYFIKNGEYKDLMCSAVFWGLAVGSHITGIFLLIFMAIFYLFGYKGRFHPSYILFFIVSLAVFFISTVVYFNAENIYNLYRISIFNFRDYYWNYFNLSTNLAPWWFSCLIFIVKITPWWFLFFIYFIRLIFKQNKKIDLKIIFLFSIFIFAAIYFFIRSAIFHYDAPHHQIHLYPFIYLIIAFSIWNIYASIKNRIFKIGYALGIVMLFGLQAIQIVLFFPNLLFYGSQYGSRFIGGFYGPAVFHCQDLNAYKSKIKEIACNKEVLTDFLPCFDTYDKLVIFANRQIAKKYEYAILNINNQRLNFPGNQEYFEYINNNCHKIYSYYFPIKIEVYALYKCEYQ